MKKETGKFSTATLVLGAVLTALTILLQLMGAFIKFGPFSISLVLVPIVIGAATCGTKISTWLGFVFGVAVLLSGDAALFLAVNIPGTVAVVLLKGALCGMAAGLIYKLVSPKNKTLAVVTSAIICPIVNTGIFLIGCKLFFMELITQWAGGTDVGSYIITTLIGFNFLIELGINIILSPVIVRLLKIKKSI